MDRRKRNFMSNVLHSKKLYKYPSDLSSSTFFLGYEPLGLLSLNVFFIQPLLIALNPPRNSSWGL